jgi:hypothetical protein
VTPDDSGPGFTGDAAGDADRLDLRQVWEQIPDPRDARGRRHPLGVILSLVQAAIVAGAPAMMTW